mgnify:CR=1 FL=1
MIPQIIMTIEDDSERAFITHLYGKYRKLMYYTAVKYLRDHKMAEEVIHDTLITLIGKVDVLRQKEESILPAYLVVCVKRACFNCLKRKKVEKKYLEKLMSGYIWTGTDPEMPEEVLIRQEEILQMKKAFGALSEREQQILIYKYFMEYPDEETARLLGVKRNSVRQLLTRARRALLNKMKENGYE